MLPTPHLAIRVLPDATLWLGTCAARFTRIAGMASLHVNVTPGHWSGVLTASLV